MLSVLKLFTVHRVRLKVHGLRFISTSVPNHEDGHPQKENSLAVARKNCCNIYEEPINGVADSQKTRSCGRWTIAIFWILTWYLTFPRMACKFVSCTFLFSCGLILASSHITSVVRIIGNDYDCYKNVIVHWNQIFNNCAIISPKFLC